MGYLKAALVGATTSLLCTLLLLSSAHARADERAPQSFDIRPQRLAAALSEFARQSHEEILFAPDVVAEKRSGGVRGTMQPLAALKILLNDSGLPFSSTPSGAILIGQAGASPVISTAETTDISQKEGKKTSSQDFRVAQLDQGKNSQSSTVVADNKSTSESSQKSELQEIVVTAQKREERLQNVPMSISVLGGQDLDKSSFQGVTDALTTVPGVAALKWGQSGGTLVTIRGVAPAYPVFGGASPIAYYLDGVPFNLVDTALAPDASAYDLQRVEVLRGPQGTLYGASALNGVVRVLTNDANLNEFEVKVHAIGSDTEGGSGNYTGGGAINVPIVEGKVAVRAVADYQNLSGWIDSPLKNRVNDAEIGTYRFKVNAQPVDHLSIGLSTWFSRQKFGAPSIANEEGRTDHRLDLPIKTDYDAYGLKVGYDFPSVTLTSTTSYLNYRSDDTADYLDFIGFEAALFDNWRAHVFSEELNLNSNLAGPWRWTAGAIYRRADNSTSQTVPAFGATLDWKDISKSYAAFGELTYLFLGGKLEGTIGGRYFHDEVSTQEGNAVPPSNGSQYYREEAPFHAVTPRAVLAWHPSTEGTVYGSYSEGFRSGAPQTYYIVAGVPGFPAVRPDKLHNFEVGTKLAFFDRRLSLDAAFYYMDWKDVQQQLLLPVQGLVAGAIVNGGNASGPGFDLGLIARPLAGLELGLTASWNDLKVDSDVFTAGQLLFAKGSRLNFSAKETFGASAAYSMPLGQSGYRARLSANANYTSALLERALVGPAVLSALGDNLWIVRTGISLSAPTHWEAELFADNLTNEKGAVARNASSIIPDPSTNIVIRPRTVGVRVEYRY